MRSISILVRSLISFSRLAFALAFYRKDEGKLDIAGYRFRKYFEQTGGMFVKFGQIISLRRDLLPVPICNQLSKLLDEVPPFAFDRVEELFQQYHGKQTSELFAEFDPQPIGSASMGQVYKAKLKSGEKVAVKILRPHIRAQVESDMRLIRIVAVVADFLSPLTRIPLSELAREFGTWVQEETDYEQEAQNLQDFYDKKTALLPLFQIPSKIRLPKLYKELCTPEILVMEFIEGITVSKLISYVQHHDESKIAELKAQGYDFNAISRTISLLVMKQYFIDGYFNADPHPANIIVTPEQEIVFIDFGLVGRLDRKNRLAAFRFFRSLTLLEGETAYKALLILMDIEEDKGGKLHRAMMKMVKQLQQSRDAGEVNYKDNSTQALFNLVRILYTSRIKIPPSTAKALRAMANTDGIVHGLTPDVTFEEATQDVLRVALAATYINLKETLTEQSLTKLLIRGIGIVEEQVMDL